MTLLSCCWCWGKLSHDVASVITLPPKRTLTRVELSFDLSKVRCLFASPQQQSEQNLFWLPLHTESLLHLIQMYSFTLAFYTMSVGRTPNV